MPSIEIGSGYNPDLSYDIHVDANPNCPHLELCGSGDDLPYQSNQFDRLRAVDVLEHFSYRVTEMVLREWCRVLKPRGEVLIQVPNARSLAERWLRGDLPIINGNHIDFSASYWILGGHNDGVYAKDDENWRYNAHYTLFSSESLRLYLERNGFTNVTVETDGGSNLIARANKK
jgi:ubiquinone/menaquinone biosynthesis C-methylase UbiE